MFNSLYAKLALVLLGLFAVLGAALVAIGFYTGEMYQREVIQKLNRDIAKQIVGQKILLRNRQVEEEALHEIFNMMMAVNPAIEVYLLDPEGNILAFSADPAKIKAKKVDVEPIRRFISGMGELPVLGDNPRDPAKRKIFSAALIPEKGNLEGYLYVILGGDVYDTVIRNVEGSYILKLGFRGVLASLVAAVFAGLLIFAYLTRRLRRLARTIGASREGAAPVWADLPSSGGRRGDEIDKLASAFKEMAERIQAQMESIRKSDAVRREMVANVSHDLRTPLATLQGYIETLLLKDKGLAPEERRNYLDIALRHCRRLAKLVSDLLELAKLEAQDAGIQAEPFSLGELVQDVLQKFQLRADQKGIKIAANIVAGASFVNGDIALIERALENLIENALRHTPEEGSVSVVLRPNGNLVTVEIGDTGPGIPEEELPKIFERFYQPDKSRRTKTTDHSGLGLAITRKIMELHGTSIAVASRFQLGSTFSFSLPAYHPGALSTGAAPAFPLRDKKVNPA